MSVKVQSIFPHVIFVFSVRWVSPIFRNQQKLYHEASVFDAKARKEKITRDHIRRKTSLAFSSISHTSLFQIMAVFPTHPATADDG